jgi:hypothetical protein
MSCSFLGAALLDGLPAPPSPMEAAMGEPTEAQINDACMWYRHDFGLLQGQEREMVRFQAKEWLRAWGKALPAAPAEDVRAVALKEAADVDWSTGRDVADTAPGYLTDWQRGFVAGQTAMRNAILALIPEAKP